MFKIFIAVMGIGCLLVVQPGIARAGEDRPVAYGWQLMTEQERIEFRSTLGSLETEEERRAFRMEHHRRMQERAEELGVTLPDEPGTGRGGPGPRDGSGPGHGPGGWRTP